MVEPKVKLIGYMQMMDDPNPEKMVAAAAKLCYSQVGVDDLLERTTDENAANFVSMLSEIGHESPIEHASFMFGIEGVSRSFLAQMTRHRLASYSVQSQRYVNLENGFESITPPEIAIDPETQMMYDGIMENTHQQYIVLTKMLKARYMEAGMESKPAEKKALEDARMVLPNACETKMVVTMNARSLMNFFQHRMCNRAQWEIRNVANQMLDLVLEVAPNIFSRAGAPCTFGKCHEGNMSCGQPIEPKEKQLETIEQQKQRKLAKK